MKRIFIIIFPIILLLTIFAFVVYGNTFDMYRFFAHLSTIDLPSFDSYLSNFDEIINSPYAFVLPLELVEQAINFIIDLLRVPVDILIAIAKGLGY